MRAKIRERLRRRMLRVLAPFLPACREVTAMISRDLDHALSGYQRLKMRLHLQTCSLCLKYYRHLSFLHDAAQHYDEHVENQPPAAQLTAEARERMQRTLTSAPKT